MLLTSTYNYSLVALSVFIGMSAAYAALDLAGRVTSARGWLKPAWLSGGAVAMGIGIWSMHFTGMKAFSLPVPVAYDLPTVLLSLLSGIFAAAVTLFVASREKVGAIGILCASVMMGAGIVSVHYVGMDAMRMAADCRYSPPLVTLSVALAILTSLVGLWLGFHFRDDTAGTGWQKIVGALVAGGAISSMHYTGMAAATFVPSALAPDLSHAVTITTLGAAAIAIATIIVQGLAVLTSYVDRRFAAQKVELLSSQLLSLQEAERRRIARDLHDDLGQALFAIKLNVGQALKEVSEERARMLLSEIQDKLGACIDKLRALAQLLHPPELETLGLKAAIVVFLDAFRKRSGIQVDIDMPAALPLLPRSAETALFRVVQECLLNVQRHSGSSKAWIRIETASKQITLEVKDEGVGMQPAILETVEGIRPRLGVGLTGMSERMKQLGGRLEISSGGWGTSVKAVLPLELSELRQNI
jgi:signal transduction histidine kinase